MTNDSPKVGDLRVWWIPQVPGKAFYVNVPSAPFGAIVEDILARYDAFQFENNIKPNYCNVGGLQVWDSDSDGEGNPGWVDWEVED